MHNLTTRYYAIDHTDPNRAARENGPLWPDAWHVKRAELPGRGIVPVRLLLVAEHYGPRERKTRMGIIHREIASR